MSLPSSGHISLVDIYTEIHGSPPSQGAGVSLATLNAASNLADKTAPYNISDFYGYSQTSPDPSTSILTFDSYNKAAGYCSFSLSAAIPSTAISITSYSVTGYTGGSCGGTGTARYNSTTGSISAGSTTGSGYIGYGGTYGSYKKDNHLTVNGTFIQDGGTISIGSTTVTVSIDSTSCN